MRLITALMAILIGIGTSHAQRPMYVVAGKVVESIDDIPHENIERIDVLPADDSTIAEWGSAAHEGVIIVTLRYDTPASFNVEGFDNFTDYLADTVVWSDKMSAERVSLRIVVDAEGRAIISEVLQSTSRNFLRRVEQAIERAPRWSPAMRDGKAIESIHLVNLLLPKGKSLPVEPAVIVI